MTNLGRSNRWTGMTGEEIIRQDKRNKIMELGDPVDDVELVIPVSLQGRDKYILDLEGKFYLSPETMKYLNEYSKDEDKHALWEPLYLGYYTGLDDIFVMLSFQPDISLESIVIALQGLGEYRTQVWQDYYAEQFAQYDDYFLAWNDAHDDGYNLVITYVEEDIKMQSTSCD